MDTLSYTGEFLPFLPVLINTKSYRMLPKKDFGIYQHPIFYVSINVRYQNGQKKTGIGTVFQYAAG